MGRERRPRASRSADRENRAIQPPRRPARYPTSAVECDNKERSLAENRRRAHSHWLAGKLLDEKGKEHAGRNHLYVSAPYGEVSTIPGNKKGSVCSYSTFEEFIIGGVFGEGERHSGLDLQGGRFEIGKQAGDDACGNWNLPLVSTSPYSSRIGSERHSLKIRAVAAETIAAGRPSGLSTAATTTFVSRTARSSDATLPDLPDAADLPIDRRHRELVETSLPCFCLEPRETLWLFHHIPEVVLYREDHHLRLASAVHDEPLLVVPCALHDRTKLGSRSEGRDDPGRMLCHVGTDGFHLPSTKELIN